MRGTLASTHLFLCSLCQTEARRGLILLVVGFGRQESAGLGCGVLVWVFRIAVIGNGCCHAGAIGTRRHGDIASGGNA